ncbi:Beta-lactamase [Micromonospora haikouensis]|uniref:Beta-lactamase n=1 Tax=Micromonospora haikouensis TaxID=686309 RepID=A0A1C4X2L7_9ACTN|nr:Beta-lactamase [Micromonospora haikouensis]
MPWTTVGQWAAQRGGNPVLEDVARRMMAVGPPGYAARVGAGPRVTRTAAGLADISTGRRMAARDQFEAGSNTKTFTAVLALQLVDRGQLRLDAPVSRYLPQVVPNGRNITVRMLLNHTSGLFSYTGDEAFMAGLASDPQRVWTEAELLAVAFAHEPNFAPGTGWSYSNTNYTLLGMIIEKLTGKGLPELVRQRIAAPLGLRHTYFADPRAVHTGPGYAHGYGPGSPARSPATSTRPPGRSAAGAAPPGPSSPPPTTSPGSSPPCCGASCSRPSSSGR